MRFSIVAVVVLVLGIAQSASADPVAACATPGACVQVDVACDAGGCDTDCCRVQPIRRAAHAVAHVAQHVRCRVVCRPRLIRFRRCC